ncbi:ROK family protein [Brachybacterium alimentarium]|uniref:ROK family protein n=1 Tax=Brachybacterium alimentarium TaxID=47845 RepID=UPI003FD13726
MRPGAVLGVDIGGTSVTADLVTCDGVSLEARRRPTGHGDAALDTLASLLVECAGMAATHGVQLQGIGVLSPGHVEEVSGVVHFASNLGWREVSLAAALRRIPEIAEVPLTVGHDVRWAGIAEGTFGAARDARDYAVLSIGTGIAACLVAGGAVLSGATGSAGEVGHATVVAGGDLCACGRRGCLDAYASGAGLLRRYAARSGRTDVGSVAELVAARDHDHDARVVWDEGIDALAAGLCTLIMTIDPAVISLVGGVSRAGVALTQQLGERLSAEAGWKSVPPLVVSPLHAMSGRAGAVLLGMQSAGCEKHAATWSAQDVSAWERSPHAEGAR